MPYVILARFETVFTELLMFLHVEAIEHFYIWVQKLYFFVVATSHLLNQE